MAYIPKSATPRILRAANVLNDGMALLKFLRDDEQRAALKEATAKGLPAVAGISPRLAKKFPWVKGAMPARQFVGMVVKAIMIEEGYEVADTGVKLTSDPVFSSGARYRLTEQTDEPLTDTDLLERFVKALTEPELRAVIKLADRELQAA